ncbi:MAG: beta-propeller fold lactonase family protein [Xanthomonadales bacterium]|nr:beta-propeller fold lactonase family protein [Xanthomonadales bacterium]
MTLSAAPSPLLAATLAVTFARALGASTTPAAAAGVLLVGNKSAASVHALDLADGRKLAQFETGDGPHEIEVSPDQRWAVVSDYGSDQAGNSLTVIDWSAREVSQRIDLGEHSRPHGMAFLPDGRRLAVTTEGSDSLVLVDLAEGTVLQAINVGGGLPHMVALSPDGRRAYVTRLRAGMVSVVDLDAGKVLVEIATGDGAEGVAVSPDGREVWVGNRGEDTISIIDAESLELQATLASEGFPIRVTMSADGRHVLVTNARAATLSVFDRRRRELAATVNLSDPDASYQPSMLGNTALPIGSTFSADGRRAFVAISGGDQVAVIDTGTWQVLEHWPTGREPDALAVVATPESRAQP